jgi:hypothetical protein
MLQMTASQIDSRGNNTLGARVPPPLSQEQSLLCRAPLVKGGPRATDVAGRQWCQESRMAVAVQLVGFRTCRSIAARLNRSWRWPSRVWWENSASWPSSSSHRRWNRWHSPRGRTLACAPTLRALSRLSTILGSSSATRATASSGGIAGALSTTELVSQNHDTRCKGGHLPRQTRSVEYQQASRSTSGRRHQNRQAESHPQM